MWLTAPVSVRGMPNKSPIQVGRGIDLIALAHAFRYSCADARSLPGLFDHFDAVGAAQRSDGQCLYRCASVRQLEGQKSIH